MTVPVGSPIPSIGPAEANKPPIDADQGCCGLIETMAVTVRVTASEESSVIAESALVICWFKKTDAGA